LNPAEAALTEAAVRALWSDLGEDFFLRHTPPQIAAMTQALIEHDAETGPYIEIRDTERDLPGEGATQIYIFCEDQPRLFASSVMALSQFQLNIVDATVSTSPNGMCFDCYTVIDKSGNPLERDAALRRSISAGLRDAILSGGGGLSVPSRLLSRRLRQLPRPTVTRIQPTPDGEASTLTLIASDRPGLLATIAMLLVELHLQVLSAKIATLGERVEDIFVVQTTAGEPIAPGEATYFIENTLRQRLDLELGVNEFGQTTA